MLTTQTSFEGQVWQLYFDGASRTSPWGHMISGVGFVLMSPQNYVLPGAFSLIESCSNNIAEYNTLLIGMKITKEISVKNLKVYGDSKLIVNQVCGEYEVRMKTWYLITKRPFKWQRSSEASISNTYVMGKIRTQMHRRPLSLPGLYQSEWQRKYLSLLMTLLPKISP